MKKTLRSLLALVLSLCMVLGMAGAVFAKETQENELSQLLTEIQSLMNKYGPEIDPAATAGYRVGTGVKLDADALSYYVAIGDASVQRQKGTTKAYPTLLAEALDIDCEILYEKEILIEAASEELIAPNAAEIQKADLVTIGFSVNGFALVALDEVLRDPGEASYLDWSLYLPEEGVAEVKDTLARMEKYLKETGMDNSYGFGDTKFNVAEALVAAAESFAFGTMAYANHLPKVVDQIHELNPDATVMVVGMDNPMEGATVKLSSGETMDLGDYVAKLIGFTGRISQTVAIQKANTVYVPISHAANTNDGQEIKDVQMITMYMPQNLYKCYPNDQGHAYIAGHLQGAMYLAGDINNDGEVTYLDAMDALQASVGLMKLNAAQIYVCDTDYDDEVTYLDAMEILRAAVGLVPMNK